MRGSGNERLGSSFKILMHCSSLFDLIPYCLKTIIVMCFFPTDDLKKVTSLRNQEHGVCVMTIV